MIIIFKLKNNFINSDSIPIFNKHIVGYFREENQGFISFSTKDNYQYPMLLNKSSLDIIALFDGTLSLKAIIEKLIDKYGVENKKLIEKDIYNIILKLWTLGLIKWKNRRIPYMEDFKYKVNESVYIEVAFDNKLSEIYRFLKNDDIDSYEYTSPLSENDWKDNYILRNSLFTMNSIILMIYLENKLQGVIILSPQNSKSTSLRLEYIKLTNIQYLSDFLCNINKIIKDVAIKKYSKIYLYTRVNNSNDNLLSKQISNVLIDVCTLEKEINNLNIEMYEYYL
ncbi:PqqD family protein [Catenibacterium mitsuokai]|uniref:PqqD family protein n=1 Tax=Catenibacterium mitsuokai TaxID=100886 RepID=UPI001C22F15E|nr:PqqD family protein [Catenibacterium mitsuokai]MBU9058067.1 PqqD family protein [Catenibacterium mitsuokai]